MKIFVRAANQISLQKPLCEDWIDNPIITQEPYCRAIDPDFKQFISPIEARRLGKVLKRALAVSLKTLRDSNLQCPDAIITGTGLGSVESTEAFLTDMCENGEHELRPTHFMQSTHNTISSLIAINTKCHGYNSTYSHKDVSFQSALYDAYLQLKLQTVNNVLVEGHDGITPVYFHLLELVDYVGNGMKYPCGEVAMAALLHNAEEADANDLCELVDCKVLNNPSDEDLLADINKMLVKASLNLNDVAIMLGTNGKEANDITYRELQSKYFAKNNAIEYKNIFGECFTANALGFYAAAHLIAKKDYLAILSIEKNRDGDTSLFLLKKAQLH